MSFIKRKYPSVYSAICPKCNKKIKYYRLGGMGQVYPHFYCDKCSNVYYNNEDKELVIKSDLTESLFNQIITNLPACPCGGHFCANKGPKCPYCNYRQPRTINIVSILTEPHAIIMKGYALFSKKHSSSYLLSWLGKKLIAQLRKVKNLIVSNRDRVI
jgi:hypothetical protein